ncbi:MAG: DEAD/DEAH box helicase family protein, partial [Actinocrinis sp.]
MTVNRRTTFAADLGATAFPDGLRDYQTRAVQRVEGVMSSGRSRCWLVLPPGAGKTLTALEAARRLGNRVVVFVPNTAIQGQWMRTWQRFVPQNLSVGTDRDLRDPITVLTYQSLAVFDGEADASSAAEGSLLDLLHGNGRALVAALREAGPLTIVLDECHHLLEVWGRLVAELLDGLDAARVIGLTATPPDALTTGQAELVRRLFGEPLYGASLPAVIKSGYLAPFAELAYLVEPTFVEAGYIHGEAGRFAEFRNDLMDPEFATTGFLAWCDGRFVERTTDLDGQALPWVMLERQDPKLADAALRLHHAGLLALPPGARVREQHRQSPTAEDWVALLDTYVDECLRRSADERDASAVEAIRKALPAIGYRLTSKGIRAAQSPVDRVLARSDAKTDAAVEIVAAEGAQLGAQLRALVLCDFEQAAASSSARLAGVLDAQAGAALLTLRRLTEDDRTADLSPMLVTGRTVAAGHEDARAFVHWVKSQHPDRDLDLDVEPHEGVARVRGNGNWTSRTWVALVTSYFESGGCRVLVGTRALLGEGWDARGVNAVIDLTGATTVGSIVQMRGRGLRLDPQWAEKVTNNWTVVCVTGEHPKGAADWNRFVRKHEGYLAVTATGDVMSGIGHVDPTFSPYAPPESALLGAVNATMLTRAERR